MGKTDFVRKLEPYPHSFQLQIDVQRQEKVFRKLRKEEKGRLDADLYPQPYQQARVYNLLTYISWHLRDATRALEYCEKALELEGQGSNLVSLANKTFILSQQNRDPEAKSLLKHLEELKEMSKNPDFDTLKLFAKAELAESYSRLGRHVKDKVIELFRELILTGRSNPLVSQTQVNEWRYGLALMYRQSLNMNQAPYNEKQVDERDLVKKALRQFLHVVRDMRDFDKSTLVLQAKAYAEIAMLMFSVNSLPDKRIPVWVEQQTGMPLLEVCDMALGLDGEHPSVLRKVARIYRYQKDIFYLDRVLELLDKAAEKEKSTSVYHERGLCYKQLALAAKKYNFRKNAPRQKRPQQKKGKIRKKGKWKHRKVKARPVFNRTKMRIAFSGNADIDTVKRIVNSPDPDTLILLAAGDQFVKDTVDNLRKAVKLSNDLNTRAMLDLAIIYIALEMEGEAISYLKKLCHLTSEPMDGRSFNMLDVVVAFEQWGLILLKNSRIAKGHAKKKAMRKKGMEHLETALQLAARHFSANCLIGKYPKETLISAAVYLANNDRDPVGNLRTQINLFKMFGDKSKVDGLIRQLEEVTRKSKEKNPDALRTLLEHNLRKNSRKSAYMLELLIPLINMKERLQLLNDGLVQTVYLRAAKSHLLHARPGIAAHCFRSIVDDVFGKIKPVDVYASYDDNYGDTKHWHFMVLHEDTDDGEEAAHKVVNVLEQCGLKGSVTRQSEHVHPSGNEHKGTLQNLDRSRSTIVVLTSITSSEHQDDEGFVLFVDQALAKKPICYDKTKSLKKATTLVVKMSANCKVPVLLRSVPSFVWPSALNDFSLDCFKQGTATHDDDADGDKVVELLNGFGVHVGDEVKDHDDDEDDDDNDAADADDGDAGADDYDAADDDDDDEDNDEDDDELAAQNRPVTKDYVAKQMCKFLYFLTKLQHH